jgi:hypothetical protein
LKRPIFLNLNFEPKGAGRDCSWSRLPPAQFSWSLVFYSCGPRYWQATVALASRPPVLRVPRGQLSLSRTRQSGKPKCRRERILQRVHQRRVQSAWWGGCDSSNGVFALRIPKFRDWVMHLSPSKAQISEARLWVLLFAAALIIPDLYFLLRRSSKRRHAVQQELQAYQERQQQQPLPVYRSTHTVGRPSSRNAFELLNGSTTSGHRALQAFKRRLPTVA